MKKMLLLLMICCSFMVFSQEVDQSELEIQSVRTHSNKVDSTSSPVVVKEKHAISIVVNDSVVVTLKDDPIAAKIDSLWKKELLNSDLFDIMTKTVQEDYWTDEVVKDLSTDTLKARLARLDAKTPLHIEYNPTLEKVIHSYLNRNKKAMERLMALSTYYFPMFEKEMDKYDIPLEIKYLAIVESALNPRARSHAGATGLWQFMYATGKMHGLDVNSYVDERMDPVRATEAACQYLSSLYNVFGDWDLVLASYNSGPGNVSKAIRRSGGRKNYWNLRPFLPRETAGYVPAFIATYYLFEYANEHGFNPQKPHTTYFETDTVRLKQTLTFDQVAKVTGVDKDFIQFLNPSFKLDVIPNISKKNYAIRLPKRKVGLFVNNETEIYALAAAALEKKEKPLKDFLESENQITYRVKQGDYLGKIANQYNVPISHIKRWNGLKSNRLRIGQKLVLYLKKPSNDSGNSETLEIYTVKAGDSLWSISKKFPGITVKNIQKWNDISGSNLKPGMKLRLSKG
ncbi:MAG TPA: LysM peptidoglycan-binding domain-containing protein [Salinimicrobium sp.]|nr:LysM peptidoglycan-binding domain-containing protein [Salinimicrobium sp.]